MGVSRALNGLLIASIALLPALASVEPGKCTPGSYWSERDQKCIWANDR